MLIIRNLNLISVQSWTYLRDDVEGIIRQYSPDCFDIIAQTIIRKISSSFSFFFFQRIARWSF